MPLSSLKISGFKSFADPVTLNFSPGVTGIVGPNGSGKSNITEAVRWAMGEQSAKGLRGERMPDVIFAGSELRPPLNLAEVTLSFDNHDHVLKHPADLVEVTRRIYRSGNSEFFINQKACRLKDISNLFMDSGLGKTSFSIISQGQVEAIFNSRPEDRRGIIEETAGVHQYKLQKETAVAKLKTTGENLARIEDIISEIKSRLEPLHQQSSLATEYQTQKRNYDQLLQTWLVYQIETLNAQKIKLGLKIDELTHTSTKLKSQKKTLETDLTQHKTAQSQIEQQLDDSQNQLVSLTQALAETNTQLQLAQERGTQAETQRQDALKHQQGLQAQLQEASSQQAKLIATQSNLRTRKAAVDRKITKLTKASNQSKNNLNQQIQQKNDDYVNLLQKQAQFRNSITLLKKQQQSLQQQAQHYSQQIKTKQVQIQTSGEQLAKLQADFQKQVNTQMDYVEQLKALKIQREETQTSYQKAQTAYTKAMQLYQQAKGRLASLNELQTQFAGFYQGPKYVLQHQTQWQGVLGAVADLIQVPKLYQIAIESALGGQLQNIVVANQQIARECIQRLRQNRQGRATFLPLDAVRQYATAQNILLKLQNLPGFLGIAEDLVQSQADFQPIVRHLLGNLIIAQDLKQGIVLANIIDHRYRIVTLDGDLLSTSGAMSGGANNKQRNGLLQQKAQIKAAQQQITQMKAALKTQEAKLAQQQNSIANLNQQTQHLQQLQAQTSANDSNQKTKITRLENETDYLKRESQALRYSQNSTEKQAAEIAVDLQQNENLQNQGKQTLTDLQQTIDTLKTQLADFDTQQATFKEQLNQAQIAATTLSEKMNSLQIQLTAKEDQVTQLQQQLAKTTQKLAALASTGNQQQKSKSQLTTEIVDKQKQQTKLKATIDQLKLNRVAEHNQTDLLQNKLTRQIELLESLHSELQSTKQKQDTVTTQITNNLEQLETDFQQTFQATKAEFSEKLAGIDIYDLKEQLKLSKRTLDEIGPVNLSAIAEYQEVKQRFDFLNKQQTDLLEAKNTLIQTITEMDHEVASRFAHTFAAVSQAFSEIFPQMFGGGHAKLTLTDPDDLLTTGIEIIVSPPGKKLQQLSLLSGGERALTAITLMFAIIKVRPVPFVILDEVEASLDDANVARFGDFLQAYDAQTQFIVITHRKGTMVRTDRLYGVTMQPSGVSKIVAVSLKDQAQMQS